MSEEKTLEQLLPELHEAKKVLDQKIEEEKDAGHRTTDARNVYNGLCKRVDKALEKMKAEAPWNTDWYSALHHPGHPVGGQL